MTFDAKALTFAAELARDGVIEDTTDYEIILAVEEYVFGTGTVRRFSGRLQEGVVAAFDATERDASDAEIKAAVRRVQSRYGLC